MDYLVGKNPDAEFRAQVVARIKANGGYCISKFERSPDTKCHCKAFKENGDCECGLFIKVPCYEIAEGS